MKCSSKTFTNIHHYLIYIYTKMNMNKYFFNFDFKYVVFLV